MLQRRGGRSIELDAVAALPGLAVVAYVGARRSQRFEAPLAHRTPESNLPHRPRRFHLVRTLQSTRSIAFCPVSHKFRFSFHGGNGFEKFFNVEKLHHSVVVSTFVLDDQNGCFFSS